MNERQREQIRWNCGAPQGSCRQVQLYHLRWDAIKRSAAFNLQTQVKFLKDRERITVQNKPSNSCYLLFTACCIFHQQSTARSRQHCANVAVAESQRWKRRGSVNLQVSRGITHTEQSLQGAKEKKGRDKKGSEEEVRWRQTSEGAGDKMDSRTPRNVAPKLENCPT